VLPVTVGIRDRVVPSVRKGAPWLSHLRAQQRLVRRERGVSRGERRGVAEQQRRRVMHALAAAALRRHLAPMRRRLQSNP
jgi:hypothetical protein